MSKYDHLKTTGLEVSTPVHGFHHAKAMMKHLVSLRIVKCDSCHNPAVTIFWQDQAEYYFRCHDHDIGGEQWTGSTRWHGNEIGVVVIPELAREWYAALPEEEQALYTLQEFDSTNYYALIEDGKYLNGDKLLISGDHDSFCRVYAYIYALTCGGFAYQCCQQWRNSSHFLDIVGIFDTADSAFQAAKDSWDNRT